MSQDGTVEKLDSLSDLVEQRVTDKLHEVVASRSIIEQAKGMLMVIYAIDGERAFDLLKWRSQKTNVKIRDLAEQLCAELVEVIRQRQDDQVRSSCDAVLLSVHERVPQLHSVPKSQC